MKPMRRIDRQRDETFARELLHRCEYAVLSTVNPDGSPYCIPISPVLVENTIYFHCALEGQKVENILNNARVCLACVDKTHLVPEHFTTEYQSAVVTGEAHMVDSEAEKRFALRKLCEKYTPNHMHLVEQNIDKSIHRTGICAIVIDSITGKEKKRKEN